MEAPSCECHGIPMYWHKRSERRNGGTWRCREARKALDAARWQDYYYKRMSVTVRAPRMLKKRRREALQRRRERQTRSV